MKHRAWLAAVVLVGGCASPPAHRDSAALLATKFEAGPGPYTFDCNEGSGRYDERNAHVPDGRFTVNGSFQFVSLQTDAKWAPLAAVELAGPSEKSSVGFTAFLNPHQPGKIQIGIRNMLRGKREPAVFTTLPYTNAAISFDLSLAGPGELMLSVGDVKKAVSYPQSAAFTRARMVCSTGHVQFSNVIVASVSD